MGDGIRFGKTGISYLDWGNPNVYLNEAVMPALQQKMLDQLDANGRRSGFYSPAEQDFFQRLTQLLTGAFGQEDGQRFADALMMALTGRAPPPRTNVNPANVNPANVNPANVNPANVNPANVNPANVNPANVNPANVNPANVNPANVNPANVNPANVNPANVNPANVNPANVNPANVNPANVNPANVNPANVNPANVNPANVNPANVNPANVNPANVNPANVNPANVNPANVPGRHYLPFYDAKNNTLDPNQLAQAFRGYGVDQNTAANGGNWMANNVSPEQFYQPLWNSLGGRGRVDLDQLGQRFAPVQDNANLKEQIRNQQIRNASIQNPRRRPVNPANVNPANVNPANVNPANVNPANVNPANVNPANVNPANVNPANVNPANVNPANVNPANVNPANVNPANVNPSNVNPANVNPANVRPANTNPANVNPANVNPANVNPSNVNPANVNPANVNPSNVNPANVNPSNVNPANVNPANANPANTNPANVRPANTNPANTNPANTNPANTNPANTNPTNTNPTTTVRPATTTTPPPALTLDQAQSRTVQGLHGQGARILDSNNDGRVNAGDIVQKADGSRVTFDQAGAAEFNQRANLINVGLSRPDWRFNGSATPALYDASGNRVQENQYWRTVTTRNNAGKEFSYLALKDGVNPADAVEDMRRNANRYGFDCATSIRIADLVAAKDTLGADQFNRNFNGLWIHSNYDSNRPPYQSGDMRTNATLGDAQMSREPIWVPNERGNQVRNGQRGDYEFQAHQPGTNDQLRPGDWRYYENRGDVSSANQGWNVIYLGENPPGSGNHEFWKVGSRETFRDRNPGQLGSGSNGLPGEYLSDVRRGPDGQYIAQMQNRR